MKLFKLAFISVVFFAVILFLLSLLIPSTVRVSRAIDIRTTTVPAMLADPAQWHTWNELFTDSIRVRVVSNTADAIHTIWSYRSQNVPANFTLHQSNGITVVQWYFEFHLRWYPWEKLSSIVLDKQYGPVMEKSLNNLKNLTENSQ